MISLIIIDFSLGVTVGEIIMLIISRKERKQYRAPLQKMNNSEKTESKYIEIVTYSGQSFIIDKEAVKRIYETRIK